MSATGWPHVVSSVVGLVLAVTAAYGAFRLHWELVAPAAPVLKDCEYQNGKFVVKWDEVDHPLGIKGYSVRRKLDDTPQASYPELGMTAPKQRGRVHLEYHNACVDDQGTPRNRCRYRVVAISLAGVESVPSMIVKCDKKDIMPKKA